MSLIYVKELFTSLEKLKQLEKVYIVGHRIYDVDCFVSTKILSDIFKEFNINAIPAILTDINNVPKETLLLVDKMDLDINDFEYIKDVSDKHFILVDHSDRHQSIGDRGFVELIIDHHPPYGISEGFISVKSNSTALLILRLFAYSYKFSAKQEYDVLLSSLIDTCFLRNSKVVDEEYPLMDFLSMKLDVNKLEDEFFLESNFSLPTEKLFRNGIKEHSIGSKVICSSYVETKSKSNSDKIEELVKHMGTINEDWIFIVINFDVGITEVYIKKGTDVSKISLEGMLSRGTDIIPMIKKMKIWQ